MDEFKKLSSPGELQTVRDIAAVIWPETFKDILSGEQICYMMQMMYAPDVMTSEFNAGYTFEVLVCDGRNAGYMVYSPCSDEPETMKLHKLYLLKEYHGSGRGQKMLDHVASQCRAAGFSKLRLNVNKYNARAIKAYRRNGFVTAAEEKNDIGHGFFMDDFVMQKVL